jgi:uncharacterized protein YhhL (DUF1145 family)
MVTTLRFSQGIGFLLLIAIVFKMPEIAAVNIYLAGASIALTFIFFVLMHGIVLKKYSNALNKRRPQGERSQTNGHRAQKA